MVNVKEESLLTLAQARSAFPGRERLGLATLHRWRLNGVRGVRLETILIGGLRYTSREAIERFIAEWPRVAGRIAAPCGRFDLVVLGAGAAGDGAPAGERELTPDGSAVPAKAALIPVVPPSIAVRSSSRARSIRPNGRPCCSKGPTTLQRVPSPRTIRTSAQVS